MTTLWGELRPMEVCPCEQKLRVILWAGAMAYFGFIFAGRGVSLLACSTRP